MSDESGRAPLELMAHVVGRWQISDVTVLQEFDVEHNELLIVFTGYPLIHSVKPGRDTSDQ